MDKLKSSKTGLVPSDGVLLGTTTVTFTEGENVFNILSRALKSASVHFEYMNTPIYNSSYIEGIGNLYEFDCGDLSGWMYSVNGSFPSYGCSRYTVKSGDTIKWMYTCDQGRDIGGEFAYGSYGD